jgi:hypothetical protein
MSRRVAGARLVAELQRETVSAAYGDKANILQDTRTSQDAYGQSSVSTVSTEVSCSFTDKPDKEKWVGYTDIEQLAAEIRYAGAPVPAKGNRVTLTGRFDGTSYADKTFEVIGIQDRDAFGYVIALKKVAV